MNRRLTRDQDRRVLAWIRENDRTLYANGTSRLQASADCQAATNITLSLPAFSRRALLCQTSGRSRFWKGNARPLPAKANGDELLTVTMAVVDLAETMPNIHQQSPEFVARQLRDRGVPATPDLAARAVACIEPANERGAA